VLLSGKGFQAVFFMTGYKWAVTL